MILDNNLLFTAAAGQAITAGAASTNTIDLLGMGLGNASTNRIGNPTAAVAGVFGEDLGATGGGRFMQLTCSLVATFLPTTASLNIQFQGAPDTAGTNTPGTWTTYAESGAIPGTSLVAPLRIFPIAWPIRITEPTGTPLPRWIRLNFVVTAGPFTGGTLFAGMVTARDDYAIYPSNYSAV